MAFITIEGENKIAQQQGNSQLLNITHFVLANIDGLGDEPADRIETLPEPADIVDTRPVTKAGYVNTNQVVYSLTLDSTIGDYTFNWIGLKDEDDVLIAALYLADPITKTATDGGTEGNNLVRNFLVAFSGAQALTAIDAPAETWQIDFTVRLLQIDERERLSNFDIYGHDAFFAGGFEVSQASGTVFNVSAGVGYVGGIRCEFTSTQQLDVGSLPNAIWVDASLQGDLTGLDAAVQLVASSSPLSDYQDSNGINHYVAKIADINGSGVVTDTKTKTDLVEDHEGKAHPHPQYLREVEADQLYEPLGSVEAHEQKSNPHPQYLDEESTGHYSTTGSLEAGRTSGSVAMTVNDGGGNANVTFNHKNRVPDSNGNAGRIAVNVDAVSNAKMDFQLASGVTAGEAASAPTVMSLTESELLLLGSKVITESLFTGSNQSKSANGYQKLPGGLIIQWGEAGGTSNSAENVTLPITFPNALLYAGATDSGTRGNWPHRVNMEASTTSYIRVIKGGGSTQDYFTWLAIGY